VKSPWLSDLCERAPTTSRDYSRVAGVLKCAASQASFESECDALREEADRWKATARRKRWSDERSAAR